MNYKLLFYCLFLVLVFIIGFGVGVAFTVEAMISEGVKFMQSHGIDIPREDLAKAIWLIQSRTGG